MLQATATPPDLLTRAEELASGFHVSSEDVTRISRHFVQQMRAGLNTHGATQIPTFVTKLPTGSEKGLVLAVDLGGTNCRVCSIDLHGDSTYTVKQAKSTIPKELMVNESHKPLFTFIAQEIKSFVDNYHGADLASSDNEANGVRTHVLKLGFSFSFTYENVSLASGTMLQWDKGWHIPDALGRDPCQMLQTAIDELSLPVKVSALISDSVGTLMARAYTSPKGSETLVGAIFGTGTNAAYAEKHINVIKLNGHGNLQSSDTNSIMVINTEWGAFDDELVVLPQTSFDDLLDSSSTNPKSQIFEKMVSALYLGELFRLAICQLNDEGLLKMNFAEQSPVTTPYEINASLLTTLVRKTPENSEAIAKEICTTLKTTSASEEDVDVLRMIAVAIIRRAGRLSGAAIAAILLQSGKLSAINSSSSSAVSSTNTSENGCIDKQVVTFPTKPRPMIKESSLAIRLFNKLIGLLGSRKRKSEPTPSRAGKKKSTKDPIIDIGVDGSLFEFCPAFEESIWEALEEITGIGPRALKMISIGLSKDGSGVGAALAAQSSG